VKPVLSDSKAGFIFGETCHTMSLLLVYYGLLFTDHKRPFDFPSESETGFTIKLNPDSLP